MIRSNRNTPHGIAMKARLIDWWTNFPLGEAASLAFWNLTIVAFIAGAVWMAKGLLDGRPQAQCAEMYRVTDPGTNAVLFLNDLEQQGFFDPSTDTIQDYAWVYDAGELRIMIALDSGVYSAVACYAQDGATFLDLKVQ